MHSAETDCGLVAGQLVEETGLKTELDDDDALGKNQNSQAIKFREDNRSSVLNHYVLSSFLGEISPECWSHRSLKRCEQHMT